MASNPSASDGGLVSRDSVTEALRHILYVTVHIDKRFTVVDLARKARLKDRAVRSYMANDPGELREPSLSAALSLAAVLGEDAVNEILALIAFGGACNLSHTVDASEPMQLVAALMTGLDKITQRAIDGEFCGQDRKDLRRVADAMIAKLVPLSSAGGEA